MIRFEGVSKKYPGTVRPALNGVTLEVLRGEFVFLVGASGSGKTSFLRLVLKEEKPTDGAIHVLGQNLRTISSRKVPYFRRNLGVVFQDFRLLPNKTVFENVAFTLQVIGKSRGFIQEAVPDVLTMVGLDGKGGRYPHELSGGEQQRVAIARAVVNKPQILLADEPTGNLDPMTSSGIMTVLERINAGGTTILMATHEAGIVDQMKRRVIELVGGQVIRDESHGGYGVTAAITLPVAAAEVVAESQEQAETVESPVPVTDPVPEPEPVINHTPLLAPRAATMLPAPPPVVVEAVVTPPRDVPVRLDQPEVVKPIEEETVQQPAADAPELRKQYPAPVHFATVPVDEVTELPDHLNFTAKLDLRELRQPSDDDNDQNVGPTK